MRKKGIALEHHGCITLIRCQLVDGFVPKIDFPFIRALKTCNHSQRSGLSATGRTKESDEGTWLDFEACILYGIEVLSCLRILVYL